MNTTAGPRVCSDGVSVNAPATIGELGEEFWDSWLGPTDKLVVAEVMAWPFAP